STSSFFGASSSSSRPSLRPFLNMLTARPHWRANSGILFGPNKTRPAMKMIRISPKLKSPIPYLRCDNDWFDSTILSKYRAAVVHELGDRLADIGQRLVLLAL